MKTITAPGRATIRAAEGDRPRTFQMVAYTGEAMKIEGFPLPVVIDCASLDTTVQAIPALFNHQPDRPVGQIQSVRCNGRPPIVAAGVFTLSGLADDKAAEVIARADGGLEWQVSIGGNPASLEKYGAGEKFQANGRTYQGPALLAKGVKLREISFVTIGGDPATSAVVAAGKTTGGSIMSFDTWLSENGFTDIDDAQRSALEALYNAANPPMMTDDLEDAPASAAAVANEIMAVTNKYGNPVMAGTGVTVAAHAIANGWTPQQAEVQAMRSQLRPPPSPLRAGTVPPLTAAMEAAILCKAGFSAAAEKAYGPRVMEASRKFQSMSLMDVAAHTLRAGGIAVPHERQEMIRAAFSSGSLSTMLGNVNNKVLETVWREQEPTWRAFAATRSAKDFKQQTSLRPTFANVLSPLPETGSIDHGSMSEEYFNWKIASFAKMFTFDRQAVINDDLGSFSEILPGLVRAASRTLSDLVYSLILADDTNFTTGRGNKLVSSALSATSLAAAVKATKLMKDPSGNALDLALRTLVVPPSLEMTARALLESGEIARNTATDSQLPTGNTLKNAMTLAVESRLENGCTNPYTGTTYAGSATSWYAFAAPADIPVIVGFLDGRETPTVETFGMNADPNRLAMSWRVYHDFGAAFGDYRAGLKAISAAS